MNIVDLAILILMIAGYTTALNLEMIDKKYFITIVIVISILIGFITTSFGLMAMLWMAIATFAGYGLGRWRHRRDSQSSDAG